MNLPHRFRASAVRRFEPTIRKLLGPFQRRELDTLGLSPETFSCRLRDAIKAQIKYRHIPDLDASPLVNVKICVSHDGKVFAVKKDNPVLHNPTKEELAAQLDEVVAGKRNAVYLVGELDFDWLDDNYPNLFFRKDNNTWIIQ